MRTTYIAAIIILVFLSITAVTGASYLKVDPAPIITIITALVTPSIITLLALLKIEKVEHKIDDVNEQVGSGLDRRLHEVANIVKRRGAVPSVEAIRKAGEKSDTDTG